jgi:hypothetical protein
MAVQEVLRVGVLKTGAWEYKDSKSSPGEVGEETLRTSIVCGTSKLVGIGMGASKSEKALRAETTTLPGEGGESAAACTAPGAGGGGAGGGGGGGKGGAACPCRAGGGGGGGKGGTACLCGAKEQGHVHGPGSTAGRLGDTRPGGGALV